MAALAVSVGGAAAARESTAGALYTPSNAAGGNAVLVFERAANGTLGPSRSFPTGENLGSGAGLGSQGALTLSRDQKSLSAVECWQQRDLGVLRDPGSRSYPTSAPAASI